MSRPDIRAALHAKGFRPDGKGGLARPPDTEWDSKHGRTHSEGEVRNIAIAGRPMPPLAPDWSRDGLSITLPHPPKALQPNARVHWTDKHRATSCYRALARAEARILCGATPPMWKRASVEIVWSATGVRHPDPDNIVASLKSAMDGLQDAGVVANDRQLWPERPTILTKQAWAGVRLTVRGETEVVPK